MSLTNSALPTEPYLSIYLSIKSFIDSIHSQSYSRNSVNMGDRLNAVVNHLLPVDNYGDQGTTAIIYKAIFSSFSSIYNLYLTEVMVQNKGSWYVLRYCGYTNKLNLCVQHRCFEHATKTAKQPTYKQVI